MYCGLELEALIAYNIVNPLFTTLFLLNSSEKSRIQDSDENQMERAEGCIAIQSTCFDAGYGKCSLQFVEKFYNGWPILLQMTLLT